MSLSQDAFPPATRNTDPRTSFDAEKNHEQSGRRETHMEMVIRAVKNFPNKTAVEIAELVLLDRHETSRRLADAKNKGLLTASNPRKCSIKGTNMMCWSVG